MSAVITQKIFAKKNRRLPIVTNSRVFRVSLCIEVRFSRESVKHVALHYDNM